MLAGLSVLLLTFLYPANTWGTVYFDFRLLEFRDNRIFYGGPQDLLILFQLACKAAVILFLSCFWDHCLSFKRSHQLS